MRTAGSRVAAATWRCCRSATVLAPEANRRPGAAPRTAARKLLCVTAMDGDLGSSAHEPGTSLAGTAGDYGERAMPVGAAILWTPVGLAGSTRAYPIFITQQALDAVHAQLVELPDGASSIGFLVGEIYQTPDTHAPYILVESTIHVPWSIGGDHLAAALRQGRVIRQDERDQSGE